jgi:hypothetical protein
MSAMPWMIGTVSRTPGSGVQWYFELFLLPVFQIKHYNHNHLNIRTSTSKINICIRGPPSTALSYLLQTSHPCLAPTLMHTPHPFSQKFDHAMHPSHPHSSLTADQIPTRKFKKKKKKRSYHREYETSNVEKKRKKSRSGSLPVS